MKIRESFTEPDKSSVKIFNTPETFAGEKNLTKKFF